MGFVPFTFKRQWKKSMTFKNLEYAIICQFCFLIWKNHETILIHNNINKKNHASCKQLINLKKCQLDIKFDNLKSTIKYIHVMTRVLFF